MSGAAAVLMLTGLAMVFTGVLAAVAIASYLRGQQDAEAERELVGQREARRNHPTHLDDPRPFDFLDDAEFWSHIDDHGNWRP